MAKKERIKLISWNVNGIRAAAKKGFYDWLDSSGADVVCLQETKISEDKITDEFINPHDYTDTTFSSAEKKGYSGVLNYFKDKLKPLKVNKGLGVEKFDREGRVIESHHKVASLEFILFNVYFPNGGASDERLQYKLEFYDEFLDYILKLKKKGKHIIITGDYNTAHHEIDLARPKQNEKISGFMPIERAWMDKLESKGFLDTFRHFNKEPEHYSWWSFRTAARKRNVGWRIDYFFASEGLLPHLAGAEILTEVMGSDHCPVSLELKLT